MKVKEEIWSQS